MLGFGEWVVEREAFVMTIPVSWEKLQRGLDSVGCQNALSGTSPTPFTSHIWPGSRHKPHVLFRQVGESCGVTFDFQVQGLAGVNVVPASHPQASACKGDFFLHTAFGLGGLATALLFLFRL